MDNHSRLRLRNNTEQSTTNPETGVGAYIQDLAKREELTDVIQLRFLNTGGGKAHRVAVVEEILPRRVDPSTVVSNRLSSSLGIGVVALLLICLNCILPSN